MKLIPNYIIDQNSSNAEIKVYNKFLQLKDYDNWYCLHSINVANHINKREGEIDFLLIGPDGIFILEIKGGRVSRKDGRWLFTDRYGNTNSKQESPFNQAKSSFYSLRSDVDNKFGKLAHQVVMGYGVMFTDIDFNEESPEWSNQIIYDRSYNNKDISIYIKELSGYWGSRQRSNKKLTPAEIRDLVNYFRGDFEKITSLSDTISQTESELIKLTNKQYELLDSLQYNQRTIFIGGAGTGKTLLAIEKLKRNSQQGVRTLFLCYNKLLAEYIREIVEKDDDFVENNIKIASVHSYMYESIFKDKQLLKKLQSFEGNNDYFNKIMPDIFLEINECVKFDEIIVDEMQDILADEYIDVLDKVVAGGLVSGKWLICMDPENQQLYQVSNKVLQKIYSLGTVFRLTTNCRNTKQISEQTVAITGISAGKGALIQGSSVKYLYYDDDFDQAMKLSTYVNSLIKDQGIKPEEITILSPKTSSASLSGSGRLRLDRPLHDVNKNPKTIKINGHVSFCSIASFKGLESPVIVLTDINELSDEINNRLNYVGFTRARSHLVVLLNKKLKAKIRVLFEKYINEGLG